MRPQLTPKELRELKGIWLLMHRRCTDPAWHCYDNYGGRGIYVCERWKSFDRFLFDMAPRPLGLVIDRADNDGPYSPKNCRWVTQRVNCNNRRDNVLLELNGDVRTVAEWARVADPSVNDMTFRYRIKRGWDLEEALDTPVGDRKVPKSYRSSLK